MYIKDNMHFTPEGAKTLAKIISVEIEHKSELKPIAGKVRLKKNALYKTINRTNIALKKAIKHK